jgi:predicted 3-demethylubiquinone-9 3-methyltransferase (glyoxalase superfamily)
LRRDRKLHEVSVTVRGVSSPDEDQLEGLTERLRSLLGIDDAATVYWPKDQELGVTFQIKEEVLGELLQPCESSLAA